jgi:hypothetical protein
MELLWLRVGELAVKIQEDLTRLPREHFDDLKQRLSDELVPKIPPPPAHEDTVPNKKVAAHAAATKTNSK